MVECLHQYLFDVRQPYNFAQLIWDIEDGLKMRLSQYEGQDETEGWATGDGIRHTMTVRTSQPLIPEELNLVRRLVAEPTPRPPLYRGTMQGVVNRYLPSVARIVVRRRETGEERFATGFVFETRAHLMTAAHVVADPWKIQAIEIAAQVVEGRIINLDVRRDIALLDLGRQIEVAPLQIRRGLQIPADLGLECVVLGFPNIPGMEPSPSIYELRLAGARTNYIMGQALLELSIPLGSGCSGAPLLTAGHSLAGMVIGYPDAQSENEQAYPWPKWTAVAVSCNDLAPLHSR